jgi:hypothetical protein
MDEISKDIKELLIQNAIDSTMTEFQTSSIYPCGNKDSIYECFTVDKDLILFWYNIKIENGMTTKLASHPTSN